MRRALALSIPILFLSGCTYDDGEAHRLVLDPAPIECGTLAQSNIDTGASFQVDAGVGIGVYIEYAKGGHWHIRASCDTDKSGLSCPWDILVFPEDGLSLSKPKGEALEPDDTLAPYTPSPGSYELNAITSSDIDGFTFDADPGAAIKFDALLDNTCTDAVRYFFWQGDGALHQGSPSNPLILMPSSE